MAKRVPLTKFTEKRGLNRISQVAEEMQCIFRVISEDDYGIDGELEVVTPRADGRGLQTSGGIIKVQAKSGASYVKKDNGSTFATPVRMDDLEYWNSCSFPVFFIVYHPADDSLYYKEIKAYIRETPNVFQTPLEVVFDKASDIFSASAKEFVCQHAAVSPPRISFDLKERLYSNLLLVTQLPKTLTFAATTYSTREEVKEEIEGYCPPLCVFGEKLYTLSDLRNEQNVLRDFCDISTIDDLSATDWLDGNELQRNLVFLFNQLFGSHCYRCGLAYNPKFKRTYFPRATDDDKDKTVVKTWTSPRTNRSDDRTVVQYYEYGADKFWRHLAAEFAFLPFGQEWFIQITPKYLFTDDGKTPSDPELVGPYTTSLKALERNPQVMNHVLFWAYILANGKRRIEMTLFGELLIVVEKEPVTTIADFSIPFDPATYEESVPSSQLGLFDWDTSEDAGDEY